MFSHRDHSLTGGSIVAECHSTTGDKLKAAILGNWDGNQTKPGWKVQGPGRRALHFCLLFSLYFFVCLFVLGFFFFKKKDVKQPTNNQRSCFSAIQKKNKKTRKNSLNISCSTARFSTWREWGWRRTIPPLNTHDLLKIAGFKLIAILAPMPPCMCSTAGYPYYVSWIQQPEYFAVFSFSCTCVH